jgi:hypothetical protein
MRAATAAEVPERATGPKTIWGPKVQQCLDDPGYRLIAEPGEDFKPGDYEGIRKKVHGVARNHNVKAHTVQRTDGSVGFWFYKPQEAESEVT